MSDADLLGYLLDALDPDDRVAVEGHLRTNPAAAARLDRLRLALVPLAIERDAEPAPPAGLALRTIARLAKLLVDREPEPAVEPLRPAAFPRAPREAPETRAMGGRFRPDLLVACGIALVAGGLVFSAIGKVRAQNHMAARQNILRTVHTGLAGYADAHDGRYPQVGLGNPPAADSFASALVDAGQVSPGFRPVCPACPPPAPPAAAVGFTFSTGSRPPPVGGQFGFRRPTATEHDLVPIAADYPAAGLVSAVWPVCDHRHAMNILFAGGNVRPATPALVVPNRDLLFPNVFGEIGAGTDPPDIVPSRP